MFNNNYEKYPYFQYNFDLYPNRDQQVNFLSAYIEEYNKARIFKDGNMSVEDIEDENDKENNKQFEKLEIEQLLKEANYFSLMSHLFWIFWSICQASVCNIQFEYLVRFN